MDESILQSLGKDETRRQGLWFEVISGELDYVRDLRVLCDEFVAPLRSQQPPVIVPEPRMEAFVREVFSTTQALMEGHVRMMDRLLERQRSEWPLVRPTLIQVMMLGTPANLRTDGFCCRHTVDGLLRDGDDIRESTLVSAWSRSH